MEDTIIIMPGELSIELPGGWRIPIPQWFIHWSGPVVGVVVGALLIFAVVRWLNQRPAPPHSEPN